MQTMEAAEMAETGAVEDARVDPQPHPMQFIAISPLDRAWFAGFALGRAGIDAGPDGVMSPEEIRSWWSGYRTGESDRLGAERTARVLAEPAAV